MTQNCMSCEEPALLKNHTQFAGTHWWCAKHVPLEDLEECELVWEMSPQYLTITWEPHYKGGFATRPLEYSCTLIYREPGLPEFTKTETGHTRHRAKAEAANQLLKDIKAYMVNLAAQQINHHQDVGYETDSLDHQPANPYNEQKVQYLLDKLQEEAAEIIQAVSKIRRFGPHNHHPDRNTSNLEELTGELEDLQAIVLALEEFNYFDPKPSLTSTIKKFNTLMG